MTLATVLPWVQIIISALLIGAVLLQQSDAGIGGTFGGSTEANMFRTKRGMEKNLFYATIILAILFGASALLALFV